MTEFHDFTHVSDEKFEAILAILEASEPAPESFVQQHRSDGYCFCGPVQHPSGAWDHR